MLAIPSDTRVRITDALFDRPLRNVPIRSLAPLSSLLVGDCIDQGPPRPKRTAFCWKCGLELRSSNPLGRCDWHPAGTMPDVGHFYGVLTLGDVLEEASLYFKLSAHNILTGSPSSTRARARQAVFWVLGYGLDFSDADIANLTGTNCRSVRATFDDFESSVCRDESITIHPLLGLVRELNLLAYCKGA